MRYSPAAIEHAIEGRPLPQDHPLSCAGCGTRLREGQPVSASVARTDASWRVARLFCVTCAPDSAAAIDESTLVEGDVATLADAARQQFYPVLAGVVVADRQRGHDTQEVRA